MGTCSSNQKTSIQNNHYVKQRTLGSTSDAKFKIQDFVNENPNGLLSEYDLIKQLGKGGYGEVWKAIHIKTQKVRAIKVIKKLNLSLIDRKRLFDEIEILKKLDHHSIVRIFEYFESDISIQIVMNYIKGKELFEKLSGNKELYTEENIKEVMRQLLGAINYIHSQEIIHGDLKSENILYDGKSITIIDFGIAKAVNKTILDQQIKGTLIYMAPEIFKQGQCYKSDIWACGIILYILFTGQSPFDLQQEKKILKKQIKNKEFRVPVDDIKFFSQEGLDLLNSMLEIDPDNRPDAKEALKSNWFIKQKTALHQSYINQLEQAAKNLSAFQFQSKLQKAIFLYILNNNLDNKDLKLTAKLFKEMDANNDGFLSFEELKNGLANIGYVMTDQQINDLFKQIDQDGNGLVTFSEFMTAAIDKNKLLTEQKIIEIFKFFDADKSGKISLEEFEAVLGKNSQLGDLKPLIDEIDINGDGEIDFQEFKMLLKNINRQIKFQLIININESIRSLRDCRSYKIKIRRSQKKIIIRNLIRFKQLQKSFSFRN